MAYTRPLTSGTALKQTPRQSDTGSLQVTLNAEVSTPNNLGVVQVGSGLSITPEGILSSAVGNVSVTTTDTNYLADDTDFYIGAVKKDLVIKLPLGTLGKIYVVKCQAVGNIKVEASGAQKIDSAAFKTLGSEGSLTVVFDGTRWNTI